MKTLSYLFATAALAVASFTTAMGTGNDVATNGSHTAKAKRPLAAFAHNAFMSTTRPGTLWLITVKKESVPVHVAIQSLQGHTLAAFMVSQNGVMQAVDCTSLPAGQYKLVMERGTQLETDTFEVK